MKEVRIIFSGNEYESLKNAADMRGITVKQLAHDRAIGVVPEDAPLSAAKILADEIAAYREVLNQIIKRETTADIRLYAILVQNQILTAQAYDDLCRRYNFEKQKIVDYDRRMPELNRQYHDLKRLEAITRGAAGIIDEIFEYSVRSELRQGITVDERIELSKMRAENAGEGIKGHEEREI